MSMSPMLTEAASTSSRGRVSASKKTNAGTKSPVLEQIAEHFLMDGFRIVIDLEKSRGSYLYDAATGHRLIDLYGFFGSLPVGFNHPHFDKPDVREELLCAAKVKVANSDIYSQPYSEFVETFTRVAPLPPLNRYLFIEGGALAIENCL